MMASEVYPEPESLIHLQAMIFTRQLTPVTSVSLSPRAPIVPATRVPCPKPSNGSLSP